MPVSNVRPINEKKYDISKHRFLELYHFACNTVNGRMS